MSDFRFVMERPDGVIRTYVVRQKEITLRGGEKIQVRYIAHDNGSIITKADLQVIERPLNELPLRWSVAIASALVQLLGKTPEEAAELAAGVKARVKGLSRDQARSTLGDILGEIGNANPE